MTIRDRIKEFRRVPASELIANPKNWRKHPEKQRKAMEAVLTEIGFAGALLAREGDDGKLVLIDGHLRAETVPGQTVPVLVLDVTEAESDKILATYDPLSGMAELDNDSWARLIDGIQFTEAEFGALVQGLRPGHRSGMTDEDSVPDAAIAEPQTRIGDIWALGGNRLLCGDSTKAKAVEMLMSGAEASLCFTSPPYDKQREYGAASEKLGDWLTLMRGTFDTLPISEDAQILVNLGLIHRAGEWIPYWEPWISWMRESGWRAFGWYVWDQGPGLPGDWNGRLAPSHEFIFHFNREARRPNKTVKNKHAGARNHGSGLRAADGKVSGYSHAGKDVQAKRIADSVFRVMRHKARGIEVQHPAVFPVQLVREIIDCFSMPGHVIYDPFVGSGTSIIAAETTGRVCYGIEIDPIYVDIAVKRWEEFTGKKAEREVRTA